MSEIDLLHPMLEDETNPPSAPSRAPVESIELSDIRVDSKSNISRGSIVETRAHPRVIQLAASIEQCGRVIDPIQVRTLDPPVPRPCGSSICCPEGTTSGWHHYDLVSGFGRVIACPLIGKTSFKLGQWPEVSLLGVISDFEAARLNLIDNAVREDISDYCLAFGMMRIMEMGRLSLEEAAVVCQTKVPIAERYIRIMRNCPRPVLDDWRRVPNRREVVAELDRISQIQLDDPKETEKRMVAEWEAFKTRGLASKTEPARPGSNGEGKPRLPSLPKPLSFLKIQALQRLIDQATEFHDTAGWRQLSDSEKRVARFVAQYISDPKATALLLR